MLYRVRQTATAHGVGERQEGSRVSSLHWMEPREIWTTGKARIAGAAGSLATITFGGQRMLFASITEFGFVPGKTTRVLRDLRRHARELDEVFCHKHYLIKTFGTTDLIEVALFNHYFRFAQASLSSSQTLRRSVGARCPEKEELPENHPGYISTVQDVLEGNGTYRPLLAVVFMGLSPIPDLCLPVSSEPLAWSVIRTLCIEDSRFWESYRNLLKASGDSHPERPLIAPLIGLDSVEVILIVRASSFEQILALGWAIRGQSLGDIWTPENYPEALGRANKLLHPEIRREEELEQQWRLCPLSRGSTTVVGMRVRGPDSRNALWRLEETPGDENTVVTRGAAFLVHEEHFPGHIPPVAAEHLYDVRPVGLADQASDDETMADDDCLMLFDRVDMLQTFAADRRLLFKMARPRTLRQVRDELSLHTGLAGSTESNDLQTKTVIAVRMRIPRGQMGGLDTALPKLFRDRLHAWRERHLDKNHKEGWTARWLRATQRKGISYSATNGVINTISAVLSRLDDDLTGFADILPALHRLIEAAEDERTDPSDIVWLAEVVERIVGSRSRRDQSLHVPHDTLAYEAHAGYRLPREAFVALAESQADDVLETRAGNRRSFVVVRDTPGSGISSRIGPCRWTVLGISALNLHDPIHWLVTHEMVHGRLAHTMVKDLDGEELTALNTMTANVRGLRTLTEESVDMTFHRISERLRTRYRKTFASPLVDAVSRAMPEIAADLCLWDSLPLNEDKPTEIEKRFWFAHGPGLIFAHLHRYGSKRLFVATIQTLILRCLLISSLKCREASDSRQFLTSALEELNGLAIHMRLKGPSHRWDATPPPDVERWRHHLPSDDIRRLLTRLQCLKEDLRISDGSWLFAVSRLLDGMRFAKEKNSEILDFIDRWLSFSSALARGTLQIGKRHKEVRDLYSKYLSGLMGTWGETGDPWPPFVEGHRMKDDSLVTFRRRRSIFGVAFTRRGTVLVEKGYGDMEGQRDYERRTLKFIGELAEHAREFRYQKLLKYLQEH